MTARSAVRTAYPCQADPDLFFSDEPADITAAKDTCGACWFKDTCLVQALAEENFYGVWGGTTGDEREASLTGGSKHCLDCGDLRPLGQFYRAGDKPDGRKDSCKACLAQRDAERNAQRMPQLAAYKRAARRGRAVAA